MKFFKIIFYLLLTFIALILLLLTGPGFIGAVGGFIVLFIFIRILFDKNYNP
ncbi:MAG: hypothetical protein ACWIPJ_01040 [Polaribacter sp.]